MHLLNEHLLWLHRCHDLDELIAALHDWRERYNEHWRLEPRGYRSPAQARRPYLDPVAAAT